LAVLYEISFKSIKAIELYKELIVSNPIMIESHIRLANMYLVKGDFKQALAYCDMAIG
jgi:tetratricopeptide (TPR) repeat protein